MSPSIAIGASTAGMIFGNDAWTSEASTAGSLAQRASKAANIVAQHAAFQLQVLGLARDLWKLDNHLRNLLETVYRSAATATVTEPPTEEQIMAGIAVLRSLHKSVDNLYCRAKAAGLTNRAFVGAALNSVHVRADDLLDLAESVEIAMNPAVDSYFDRALEDLKSGQVFDLAEFK